MTPLPDMVLTTFLVFCRIGGCLMLVPGYSSSNIPMRVRLFIAFAATLMLVPLLLSSVEPLVHDAPLRTLVGLVVSEFMVGAVIGLTGRMFLLALQTVATAAAMSIGLSTMPGTPVDDMEALPSLVPLMMISAAALFFFTDQHWEVLRGLSASYRVWPPADGLDVRNALSQITDRLSEAFTLTLRVCGPFIVYGVVVNFAVGLANKLTPSIPVYFIAMPFVLAGGLFLLYFAVADLLHEFMAGLAAWIAG
jgi:flagellar biosynthetic protein FliR